MEMQMSSKSQSFSRPTWYSALSTMASGVGPPNFSRMCFSTEPAVYADANRQMAFLCRLHNRLYTVCAADVTRIQANLVHAGLDRRQREAVVKMNVRDHRQRRAGADFAQRLCRLHIRHGTANNVAAASASARICARVAFASRVSVLVMDCTAMGAPPPTNTSRIFICLVFFIPLPLSLIENGEWKMENECAAHSAVI